MITFLHLLSRERAGSGAKQGHQFFRIKSLAQEAHSPVEMRPRGPSSGPGKTNDLASFHFLSLADFITDKVRIKGVKAFAMIKDNCLSA